MDLTRLNNCIEENRAEMIQSLSELVSIPSVAVRTPGEHPFGEHVQAAWEHMMAKAGETGFRVYNADNFGGHFDMPGSGDGILGIIGHLDVVPEADGWDFDPYGGEVIDGYVCGRGTTDDKGPVMAAFYAMKALQQCGYQPEKTVRLILGLDEETEWEGMEHYMAFVEELPDLGFTPDADFPVIHGEMGILVFDIARKFTRTSAKGLELRSMQGGTAANSVADTARAVLFDGSGAGYDAIRALAREIRETKGWKVSCRGIGKSLEISTRGVSAHGAKPEQGQNAISMLMEILGHLHFASDDITEFIRFYHEHIGFDFHGERIGCAFSDEISGKLAWNVGMIALDRNAVRLTINVRYPVTMDAEQVYDGIMPVLEPYDLGVIKGKHQAPIYIPADDPLVETLMSVYQQHTGDTERQPLVIGGGTYARAMDHIVAFGAHFPGEPEVEHQPNERISIENLVKLTKIYAEAILRLAGEHEAEQAEHEAEPAEKQTVQQADQQTPAETAPEA